MYSSPTRPRSVTMTLWMVFLLSGWNGGRALSIGSNSYTLSSFNGLSGPRFHLVVALIWAALFMGAAIALWQKRPFIRQVIPLLLILYTAYELGLLICCAQSSATRHNGLVNSLFYGVMILFAVWALNRTAVKSYFV